MFLFVSSSMLTCLTKICYYSKKSHLCILEEYLKTSKKCITAFVIFRRRQLFKMSLCFWNPSTAFNIFTKSKYLHSITVVIPSVIFILRIVIWVRNVMMFSVFNYGWITILCGRYSVHFSARLSVKREVRSTF